jgi:UDP-N-acetylmuramyl pentapeptide phosphotransferase/UDP-N-acetylglucosamine-1-phosphate transferase
MSLKNITIISLFVLFLFGTSSCIIHTKHENNSPKGWNKNKNNPHHPHTTNPGKGHSKGKNKK